tara:strand:- start:100 stop:309 length:210 start_codon:yes stop_codon:yes gene_type:complete
MKKTDEEKREKFSVPEVISSDLTYYMQFGWKRLRETSHRIKASNKYLGNTYKDNFPVQVDETNQYTGDR